MAGDIEAATPALCRLYLGMELRKLRHGARLTARQVAEATSWSVPKITRMETGTGLVEPMNVRVLCQLYDAEAELTSLLEGYAHVTKTKKDWWQSAEFRPAIRPGFNAYLGLEATATQMHEYSSEFVPGLLQSEEYVRAIYRPAHEGLPLEEIDRLVAVRMNRQEVLTRAHQPLRLTVILNEAVLRRVVGSAEVMREQLGHLAEAARLPNIKLQVVPFSVGVHPGMSGPFITLQFPDPAIKPIVYFENLASAGVASKADDVEKYEEAFADLTATALGHEASLRVIEKARKEF
ncbi:helix-turn-helix transcriptional regulator [Streptomyces pathocidini]|uniref:helix-turn-helix domain-containing protein n=1 Tax=Streptomyces pathocidini TaxID=1650571 RepID=UPI003405F4B5